MKINKLSNQHCQVATGLGQHYIIYINLFCTCVQANISNWAYAGAYQTAFRRRTAVYFYLIIEIKFKEIQTHYLQS